MAGEDALYQRLAAMRDELDEILCGFEFPAPEGGGEFALDPSWPTNDRNLEVLPCMDQMTHPPHTWTRTFDQDEPYDVWCPGMPF